MKITKEEKSLYNFLKVVAGVFAKSTGRNLIFGDRNKLIFKSGDYAGAFEYTKRENALLDSYDFETKFYELKQLPNGNYVLDAYASESIVTQQERLEILEIVIQCANEKHFICEFKKDDCLKMAKLTSASNLWINDHDLKIVNAFPEVEIFSLGEKVIIKSFGLTDDDVAEVSTTVIINSEPKEEQYTQQKVPLGPTYEEVATVEDIELQELAKEMEIEEEEDDPMS